MRAYSWLLLLHLVFFLPAASGQSYTAADSAQNEILAEGKRDIQFSSRLRPLSQIAGAPAAFYNYFWEFGDGQYSNEKEPRHQYGKRGDYPVRLWATNNYDDGKRPPIRSKILHIETGGSGAAIASANNLWPERSLLIQHNADPKPDETFICVLGYLPTGNPERSSTRTGTLLVCYNETHFGNNNFRLEEVRSYNGETEVGKEILDRVIDQSLQTAVAAAGKEKPGPSANGEQLDQVIERQRLKTLVKETMKGYRDYKIWRTNSMQKGRQNIFLQLHTTPEMIKDTNATVRITTIFIPDNEDLDAELAELEMQIVASHDPNKMKVGHNLLNYRFVNKRRKLKYTIQFQNNGQGPASTIALQTKVPAFMNTATLKVLDRYPSCPSCAETSAGKSCFNTRVTADSVFFTFRNIYLPGTAQKGVNDLDSTKGFVSYEMNFLPHAPKKGFNSQTAIIFDRNPPVITNKARNRYLPGLSPALIAGYYTHNESWSNEASPAGYNKWQGSRQLVLGLSIAPYSPYRPYLQAEAYIRHQAQETHTGQPLPFKDTVSIDGKRFFTKDKTSSVTYSTTSADVAGLVKYNINNWISLGAGVQVSANLKQQTIVRDSISIQDFPAKLGRDSTINNNGITNITPAFIFDAGLGSVRKGPALGIRYLHYFQGPATRFFFYATWKL